MIQYNILLIELSDRECNILSHDTVKHWRLQFSWKAYKSMKLKKYRGINWGIPKHSWFKPHARLWGVHTLEGKLFISWFKFSSGLFVKCQGSSIIQWTSLLWTPLIGTGWIVLIIEVSLFQSVLIRDVSWLERCPD